MKQINFECNRPLSLGRQGENEALQIVFDISDWQAEYGAGTVQLIHKRSGDTAPYPVAIETDGASVTWIVTSADTAKDGYGLGELQYYRDGTVVKSKVFETYVTRSLEPAGEAPEPYQSWVDQVLRAAADAAKQVQDKADLVNGKVPASQLPTYGGVYEIIPQARADVTLKTEQTYVDRDIVVREIPIYETSNQSGGYTANIGG